MMLGYPKDVERMVLDSQVGILQHMKAGSTLIDHSTSSPAIAQAIAAEAETREIHSIDAPVSGGDIGAQAGNLIIMTGGTDAAVESARDLLDLYSSEVSHMGGAGAGQHTKLANQMMNAFNMAGVCESLLYAQKAGLQHDKLITLLSKGGARSWWLENCGPSMIRRDFKPGF